MPLFSRTPLDPNGLGILAQATDSFGVKPNAPTNEWPFNVLSQKAVRSDSGRITREGDPVVHDYDPAELERCHRIAAEVTARLAQLPVKTINLGEFQPFCLPVNRDDAVAPDLTPDVVRAAFRGTLHPWCNIVIQPIRTCEVRSISDEASYYGFRREDVRKYKTIWTDLTKWLEKQKELVHAWYVSVEGGIFNGCKAVRLVVGRTKAGSLTGAATVGHGSGVTVAMTPAQLYETMTAHERLGGWSKWVEPNSGRVVPRLIMRTFDPQMLDTWLEATGNAAGKLKTKEQAPFWQAEFRKLTPERTLTLSTAWGALHRCLGNGRLPQDINGPQAFFWMPLGDQPKNGEWRYLLRPAEARTVSNRLNTLDAGWLKERYDALRATDYAPHMSDADFTATLDAFEVVKELYQQAADRSAVVIEFILRTDKEREAEAAVPTPKKKPKAGECEVENDMLAPLLACMDNYSVDDGGGEWPHNDLSPEIVRYGCGRIAREGQVIEHNHDAAELARCRTLATEAENLLKPLVPPHDAGGPYLAFFSTANVGDSVPTAFTEGFIRNDLFRGTISPEVGIRIGPLTAEAIWYAGEPNVTAFVDWIRAQPGLHGHAFISIGLNEDTGGACHPRLALALTDKGSVVGVCGYVIWA